MENVRSGVARAAGSPEGSSEASDAAAAIRGKKNRLYAPILVSEEGREAAAGTGLPSSWTGEKKTKIQNTSTYGDLGKPARVDIGHSSGGQEQIEGLDWDNDKLVKEFNSCFDRLNDAPPDDEKESLPFCDEQQLKALNQRLALYRIRAHEEKYRGMNDESLLAVFPPTNLEANWYYKFYEGSFQWSFDPVYCKYAHLQDYQRLMLPDNGEYEDWEYYHKTCSTLEGDQEFVQFWEKLSSKTELIELYLKRRSRKEQGHWKLLFYHGLKIAEGYPHVYKYLIRSGLTEFAHSVWLDYTRDKYYIGFLFDMWQLVTEQKLNFKDALREVHRKGNTLFIFPNRAEFEPNLPAIEERYKPHLDRIVEQAKEGQNVDELIKGTVKKIVTKPKTYYDYAKKKLGIAKEIGLIPSQPPQKLT